MKIWRKIHFGERGAVLGAVRHFHIRLTRLVGKRHIPMRDGDNTCLDCEKRRRVVVVQHVIAIVKLQLIIQ